MAQESRLAVVIDSTKAKPSADELTRALNALDAAGVRVTRTNNGVDRSLHAMSDASARGTSSIRVLTASAARAAMVLGAAFSVRGLQLYADGWSDMQSRIGAAIKDMESAPAMMERIVEIANASYSPLNQTVEIFGRNVAVLRDLGRSATEAADFTEALNHALVTTATKGQDADVVLNALSRAIAIGGLRSMEFETIMSRSPRVLEAVADELGTTVTELRRLAQEGEVTGDVIVSGLINSLERLRKEAGEMPATIGDGLVRVGTNITELIGKLDQASGASAAVAGQILQFADAIRDAGDSVETILNVAVVASTAGLVRYTAGLAAASAQVAIKALQSRAAASEELRLAQAQASQTAATLAQVTALKGLGAAHSQITAATIAHEAALKRVTAAQAAYVTVGRAALGVLGGPVGIAVTAGLAAAAFADFGTSARIASIDLDDLTRSLSELNAAQIALRQQQAEEKLVSLQEKASEAARELQALERDYAALRKMFEEGRGVKAHELENVNKTLVEQRARVADANQEVEKAQGALARLDAAARAAAAGVDTLNDAMRKTDDAGRRYLERLTDQSIIAGLKTQRQQLDALVSAGKLVFSDADLEAARKAADIIDAASRAGSGRNKSDPGSDYLKDIRERIALLGKETEYEQLLARVASGALKFRTEKQREVAEMLAKQLDDTQKQIEMEEALRDLREQQATTQMQFFRELEAFGQGERVRQLNADLAKVEDRYRDIIDARRNSPLGLSDEELAQIRESLQVELDMVRDFHEQKLAIQQDWRLGAVDALKNYADEAANVYDSVGRLATTAFKGMEDSLVSFVRTGKFEFADFADSMISDMVRIMVQQSITGPLAGAFSGMLAGAFGAAAAPAGVTPGLDWTFASGGYTGDGGKFEPAGIVHRGEGVLNQEEIKALGGEGGFNAFRRALRTGHATGGMAGRPALPPSVSPSAPAVSINIINQSSQPVQATQGPLRMDAARGWVQDIVLSDLRVNGPIARGMKGVLA